MCTTTQNELGVTEASCACCSTAEGSTGTAAVDTAAVGAGLTTNTYEVTGMTCGHCVTSVTEEVSRLDGVKNVDVQLVTGGASRVTVSSADVLDRETVAAAIDEAGYELVSASK